MADTSSLCQYGSAGIQSAGVQVVYIQTRVRVQAQECMRACVQADKEQPRAHYFLPPKVSPPPALASFLALSAARFSSLALPPLGLFFSDLALGFAFEGSLGGIATSALTVNGSVFESGKL